MNTLSSRSTERGYYVAVSPKGQVMCWAGISYYPITIKKRMLRKADPDELERMMCFKFDRNKRIKRLWEKYFGSKGIKITLIDINEITSGLSR